MKMIILILLVQARRGGSAHKQMVELSRPGLRGLLFINYSSHTQSIGSVSLRSWAACRIDTEVETACLYWEADRLRRFFSLLLVCHGVDS